MLETCFGRKQYLDLLHKRVSALTDGYRQNLAFIGDDLIGKTTVLSGFLAGFSDRRFLILFLEARQETLESFCRRFIGALLYNFLLPDTLSLREDLEYLLDKSSPLIPKTAEKIRAILGELRKNKRAQVVTDLFSLTELIHAETGRSCVVIFDEFHKLERLGIKKLFKDWAQLLMTQKHTMYIIASSAPYKARTILAKDLSLLFGNFEVVDVEPFDVRTTELYLDERLKGCAVEPGTRKFVANLTGGNPYYLSVIADGLRRKGNAGLVPFLEEILFDSAGVLNQRFSGLVKRYEEMPNGQEYVTILFHVACGCNKLPDIAHLMRGLKKELAPRVSYLIETDALRRSGDFLIIPDRLFGFWLKSVHAQRLVSLTHDLTHQKAGFRAAVEALAQEFARQASKPVAQRVAELFRLFSDDRIQMERKSLRLDRFREIKPLEFGSKRLRDGLICRSGDSVWVLAFGSGAVTEEDIAEFSSECRKYRNKTLKKIIVNLSDLDHNSHLKALEEKIITWDLGRVNQILDLYSRPRIIA